MERSRRSEPMLIIKAWLAGELRFAMSLGSRWEKTMKVTQPIQETIDVLDIDVLDFYQVRASQRTFRLASKRVFQAFSALAFISALTQTGFAAPGSSAPVALKPGPASKPALPKPSIRSSTLKAANGKTNASNLAGVVVTATYVLGPDDQITVESASHAEISVTGIKIPTDGKINLPMLGSISVSGKTVAQVEKEILARMNREGFLRPMVTVSLQGARVQQVFVLSSAGGAGSVEIRPGFRISDVLALTGGLGNSRPELTDATLSRASSPTPIALDLPSILRDSNSKANILLQNGDTIRLVPRTIQINIAGKVNKTGTLEIPIGSSLTEVIALAGGVQEKSALSRSSLKRAAGGRVIPIDFYDILVKGNPGPKIKLQEGDLILIPEAQEQVTIQGAVANPGYFSIPDGKTLRLSELVALAGGASDSASLTRTSVQHADGTSQTIDLYRILALNVKDGNIVLQPEDIITIPAYTEKIVVAGTGVRTPGFFNIEEGKNMRVLDALTMAGSLSTEPESTDITITRGIPGAVPNIDPNLIPAAPQILKVNAADLYKENNVDANIILRNGDLVMVTSSPRFVYLAGEVRTPGAMALEKNEGLVELLARAGGITDKGLASAVVVERNGVKNTIDVFGALSKGDSLNYPIYPGDNIVVPISMNRVLVMAGVADPGYVNIPEDRPLSVTEAVMLAGGTRQDTKLEDTVILRQTENGMTQIKTPIKTPQQMVAASKMILKSGDIVFVPELGRKNPNFLSKIPSYIGLGRLFGLPLPF